MTPPLLSRRASPKVPSEPGIGGPVFSVGHKPANRTASQRASGLGHSVRSWNQDVRTPQGRAGPSPPARAATGDPDEPGHDGKAAWPCVSTKPRWLLLGSGVME